jgi:hypothetical protein
LPGIPKGAVFQKSPLWPPEALEFGIWNLEFPPKGARGYLREKILPGVDFFINFDHNNTLEENEND